MRLTIKAAVAVMALGLAGCYQSQLHLTDTYGRAVKQNTVVQVADPDAKYIGTPEAGANGSRVDLAQQRYVQGQVLKPASTSTSDVIRGRADNGGAGAGASASSR